MSKKIFIETSEKEIIQANSLEDAEEIIRNGVNAFGIIIAIDHDIQEDKTK